jgi:hypothetical protein
MAVQLDPVLLTFLSQYFPLCFNSGPGGQQLPVSAVADDKTAPGAAVFQSFLLFMNLTVN